MKSLIVMGIIVLGFFLLVASGLWSVIFPPTNRWTPEKDQRMSVVKARLNDLGAQIYKAGNRTYGGTDPVQLKTEHDELMKEFEELKADFEYATETPLTISKCLKWAGISLAAVGIIGWFAVKES